MEILEYSLVDRIKGTPFPDEPFFFDANLYDIPSTVILACKNLPENCVGISILSQSERIDKLIDSRVKQYVEFVKGRRWKIDE